VLGERRRRVLENARNEKQRLNPLRSQSRNRERLKKRSRSADKRRRRGMIIITGSNKRYCARMVGAIGIRVNPFMQLRGDAQY